MRGPRTATRVAPAGRKYRKPTGSNEDSALPKHTNKILFHGGPGASLLAQMVKNPPAVQETLVQSLGWEDPLEKGKATHSSILAWRIPWTV